MIRFVAFMGSIDDAGEVNDENVEGESVDSRAGGGRCSSRDNHCTTCKVSTSTSSITRIPIFTGGCVCKYYDRQVAERSEEKRCKAEEEAEKPGRGFETKILSRRFVKLPFSDNKTTAVGDP